ncbi:MAG: D-alanine--D-alanine ligase [Candidatus Saccharibacteria bacterium]|nr:D-alanine--D-alanine ligase [Candidatus Saccharibacteria bacterium]
MTKINKHIEIIRSTTNGLISLGAKDSAAIQNILMQHYTTVGITVVNNISDLEAAVLKQPDLMFLGTKFMPADPSKSILRAGKIWVADYLDDASIAYTGSGSKAQELARDKQSAKHQAIKAGLNTSFYHVIEKNQQFSESTINLTYPVFIKPTSRGGGLGIDEASLAYNYADLRTKVMSIFNELDSDVLIEEYLPGREFSVAVMKIAGTNELSLMPIEIVSPISAQGTGFLTEMVKKSDTETTSIVLGSKLRQSLNDLAAGVFTALGSNGYGRIDMKIDVRGEPSFIEANLLPGLSDHGYMARCFHMNAGVTYKDMLLRIVSLGLEKPKNRQVDDESIAIISSLFDANPVIK